MKTLKVGALALGMMFAGCAMAMDLEFDANGQVIGMDFGELPTIAVSIPKQPTKVQRDNMVNSVPKKVTGVADDLQANNFASIFDESSRIQQALSFIKTHPKKLGVLAAVAVVTAAYLVYRKFTAKKKIQVVEEEDETEEVTVK